MRVLWAALVLLQVFGGGVNEKNKEGAAHYDEGKLEEALVAFTQAQEQSPDAPEIHYNIGNVHFRKQETDKALEEYRTALDGSPEVQARSHYNSGNVHYRAQSYPEAIDAYKEALKVDDQDLEARQNLELALQKLQEQQQRQQQDGEESSEEGDQEQQDRQDQKGQQDPSQGEQEQQQDPSQAPNQSEGEEAQPQGMSREEAERILAVLAEMERAEQRKQQENQRMRTPGSGRDW